MPIQPCQHFVDLNQSKTPNKLTREVLVNKIVSQKKKKKKKKKKLEKDV